MAKYLNQLMPMMARPMVPIVIATIIMGATWAGLAGAETLLDPTQPPMMAGDGSGEGEPAAPVLQSVMMSPGRKTAVISGQTVRVGEKFGDATLIKLTDAEAVLRNSDGTLQTLKMHPAVEKKVIVEKPGSVSGAGKTKRSASKAGANK